MTSTSNKQRSSEQKWTRSCRTAASDVYRDLRPVRRQWRLGLVDHFFELDLEVTIINLTESDGVVV